MSLKLHYTNAKKNHDCRIKNSEFGFGGFSASRRDLYRNKVPILTSVGCGQENLKQIARTDSFASGRESREIWAKILGDSKYKFLIYRESIILTLYLTVSS